MFRKLLVICMLGLVLWGCTQNFTPKPKGYNHIDLPEHAFQPLPDTLPYFFEYSEHAVIKRDSSWLAQRYWIDLVYPDMGANVQVTYKPLFRDPELLRGISNDAFKLTSKHQIKAHAISEKLIPTRSGYPALIADLSGEVPTQVQFAITDSVDHFLRGALYFRTATQNDSLRPVIEYIRADILHMLNTVQFKENFPLNREDFIDTDVPVVRH